MADTPKPAPKPAATDDTSDDRERETRLNEPDPSYSRQHEYATWEENTDLPDDNPPPGQHVIQTLGKPESPAPEPIEKKS